MNLTPFKFKKFRSDLDTNTIFQNFHTNATITLSSPDGNTVIKRSRLDIKTAGNRFIMSKGAGAPKTGKIGLLPVAHGKIREEESEAVINVFIRPFYTDILVLIAMCTLQFFCAYMSIADGYYWIAAIAILSILLAYVVVVIKFNAECRNYLALVQKCI